jgi:hypothetical protein
MTRSVTAAVFLSALALAAPASGAAPNHIVVSGPGLPKPVVLDSWAENARLLAALVPAPKAAPRAVARLRTRPRLHLALFWGWAGRPRPKTRAGANQDGWFYPAHRSQPAVLALTVNGIAPPRVAPPQALRILRRHGVPIRSNRTRSAAE